MPTRITQVESSRSEETAPKGARGDEANTADNTSEPTVLKVEGSLYLRDAQLLERLCRDLRTQTQRPVTLDLSGLSFLDSDSASVLCGLKRDQGVRLEGLYLFIEKVVELAEECERVAKYRPRSDDSSKSNVMNS